MQARTLRFGTVFWERAVLAYSPKLYMTPIGFLDTQRCGGGSASSLANLLQRPPSPITHGGVPLDRADMEALMGVVYTRHLLFEREKDWAGMHLWAMPPPVSPADPFGSIPDASSLGCAQLLRDGRTSPDLTIRSIGLVDGIDVGCGLFATAPLPRGAYLCEYTGVVQCDPDPRHRDDYAFGLPVCDPDVRISAQRYGNIARLLNHSDAPNTALKCVVHEGVIHLVALTISAVDVGEQLTVDYGGPYWRAHKRRKVAL